MKLIVDNSLDKLPTTQFSYTDANLGAGDGTVTVKNINPYTANHAIQIGDTGEAEAEIKTISSISGNDLLISGTALFDHAIDVRVYDIKYNKIIFKRSTAGTAGTATALSTVSITPDSLYTEYDDASGAASYAYKTQYYNSVSGDLSSESDWFVPGGPSFYSLQKLRSRIKGKLISTNFIKEDSDIDDWINEWIEMMTNAAIKTDKAYTLGTAQYSFGTAGIGTVSAPLFKHANKVEITSDGNTWVNSTEIPVHQFSESDTFSGLAPRHAWIGDTAFRVLPSGSSGTARFTLSQFFTPLDSDSDELPQFLKPYTTGCIEWGLYNAYGLDGKDGVADKHMQTSMQQKAEFLTQITPRDQTGVKFIDLTEGLSGREESLMLEGEVI